MRVECLSNNLLPSSITIQLLVLLVLDLLALVLRSRNPQVAIVPVLAAQVNALLALLPSLAQRPGAGGQFALDGRVLLDPVRERVLAVLDDGLAGLVAVVGIAGLAGSDGRVVDEFQEMFAVAGDDGEFLAVLAQGVELVREGCLELFAGDVGELCFSDERFGFCADELLFQDHDLWAVGLFVLQLGDLIRDLLLA